MQHLSKEAHISHPVSKFASPASGRAKESSPTPSLHAGTPKHGERVWEEGVHTQPVGQWLLLQGAQGATQ